MADDRDNDVDAGWDDIDAGWEAEASEAKPELEPKPRPDQSDEPKAKPSANERITAESDPLPSMIPTPNVPVPEPEPEPPREVFKVSEPKARPDEADEPGFTEDDVTANRLYDEELLAEAKSDAAAPEDDADLTIRPLTPADEDDEHFDEHQEVTRDCTAELMGGNETARRIRAISEETEHLLLEQARAKGRDDPTSPAMSPADASTTPKAPEAAPVKEPSGQAFEVPSPLKTSGSGPAVVPSQDQVKKPQGVNLSLIVFILLLVLALGAVGAVILAAFF